MGGKRAFGAGETEGLMIGRFSLGSLGFGQSLMGHSSCVWKLARTP